MTTANIVQKLWNYCNATLRANFEGYFEISLLILLQLA